MKRKAVTEKSAVAENFFKCSERATNPAFTYPQNHEFGQSPSRILLSTPLALDRQIRIEFWESSIALMLRKVALSEF